METFIKSRINYNCAKRQVTKCNNFHKGRLYIGETNLKTYESIKSKLKRDKDINDSIRFTIVVHNIMDYYNICMYYTNHLKTFKVTNHWQNAIKAYNGYHINAYTDCEFPFEVQIHTRKSQYWRDNKQSRMLYLDSKKALDNGNNLAYFMKQMILFLISIEMLFEIALINSLFK